MELIKSMTGYGRAVQTVNGREFTVEVRSVNNRYLDCNVKLPRMVSVAEDAVKQAVKMPSPGARWMCTSPSSPRRRPIPKLP